MLNADEAGSDEIINIADKAFTFQTIAKQQFTKKDVQAAYAAFEAFEANPSDIATINAFLDAAKVCAKYERAGFKNLVEQLEKQIATDKEPTIKKELRHK